MIDEHERFEQAFELFPMPEPSFDRLLRRRDRKRRNERIAAGVLGIAVFASMALAIGIGMRSEPIPADAPTPVVVPNMFADIHGWIAYRSGSKIMAVDPAHPSDTVSLGAADGSDPIGWSPDGTQLLLASGLQSGITYGDLLVVHADGSKTQLFPGLFVQHDANGGTSHVGSGGGSFSPDGSMIATALGGDRGGVYVIDADDESIRRLVVEADVYGPCEQVAAWSPDGSRIAFIDFGGPYGVTCHRSPYGLSFVNADGTGLQEQVVQLPLGFGPAGIAWSPDGSQLVLWGTVDGDEPREGRIYIVNADGSGLRQISSGGNDRWPAWSPDGTRLAFVHDGALYTMAPDGSDLQGVGGVEPGEAIAWNPVG